MMYDDAVFILMGDIGIRRDGDISVLYLKLLRC